jgi:nucleoside-diphosphate-sugar epimerase
MRAVRVLVTGATGKVGHAVTRALLERGDEVRALVRDPGAARIPDGAEPVHGDVQDSESLVGAISRPPLLPTGQLHFLMWNATPDSSKAQDDLGWRPTALDNGLRRTLEAMGLA